MGQLMTDHVDRDRKPVKGGAVAVPKDHLLAVPERVVVALAVMNVSVEREAVIVDRVALINFQVEVEGMAETVIGLVRRYIAHRCLTFGTNQLPGGRFLVSGVIDRALRFRRRPGDKPTG